MREIKFRIWCKNKKQWEQHEHVLSQNGKLYQLENMIHVSRKTHDVEMFTGLTDKNGVEIYEGDILQVEVFKPNADSDFLTTWWTVEYKNYCNDIGFMAIGADKRFHKLLTRISIYNSEAVVVGNIHEV